MEEKDGLEKFFDKFGEERFWELYEKEINPVSEVLDILVQTYGTEEHKQRAAEIWGRVTIDFREWMIKYIDGFLPPVFLLLFFVLNVDIIKP